MSFAFRRDQSETHQTPVDALAASEVAFVGWCPAADGAALRLDRLLLSYPLPIAFPSVTAWIARATVATLPAFSPAMEMRPSFVR